MNCFSSAKYIQAIAETGNISTAAEQLKISQPALSAQLKKLENELGTALFDRTKHPLEITEAGKIYLEYAARFQTMNKEFTQHLADLNELKRGKLTIGGAVSFNVSYLPKTIAEFAEKYPGIELDIVDGSIPEIVSKTLNGQIDLFIASTFDPDDRLNYEELLEERIFLCVPSGWALNDRLKEWQIPVETIMEGRYDSEKDIPVADFTAFIDSTFILLNRDQQIGYTMNSLFDRYNFKPKKAIMAEQTMTSYSLTIAGVGVSLMTESTIRQSNLKDHPTFYMVDPEICRRKLYVVHSAQRYISVATKAFMDMLEKNLKQ